MMIADGAILFVFAVLLIAVGVILALFGVTTIALVMMGLGAVLLFWLALRDSDGGRL